MNAAATTLAVEDPGPSIWQVYDRIIKAATITSNMVHFLLVRLYGLKTIRCRGGSLTSRVPGAAKLDTSILIPNLRIAIPKRREEKQPHLEKHLRQRKVKRWQSDNMLLGVLLRKGSKESYEKCIKHHSVRRKEEISKKISQF